MNRGSFLLTCLQIRAPSVWIDERRSVTTLPCGTGLCVTGHRTGGWPRSRATVRRVHLNPQILVADWFTDHLTWGTNTQQQLNIKLNVIPNELMLIKPCPVTQRKLRVFEQKKQVACRACDPRVKGRPNAGIALSAGSPHTITQW